MSQERKPVDGAAIGLMLLLTALWDFQQVTVKWIAADVSLVMQAALRSIIAAALLLAGLLFAGEFVFIYAGLAHTNASRMSVFIYLAPPLTALGLHLFVPSERLSLRQWTGVLVAFAGIVAAFAEGFGTGAGTWIGDLCGVIAALLWAATTAPLSVLSFLTPMFGVLSGVAFLSEPISAAFLAAALAVAVGIVLVNLRR